MSRIRTRTLAPLNVTCSLRKQTQIGSNPWSAWVQTVAPQVRSFQDSDVMTDQKTPGYFRAVREGTVIPVSPMQKATETYSATSTTSVITVGPASNAWKERFELTGLITTTKTWGSAPTAPVVDGNLALQEALSRAQNDCFDALTFAAELRKTLESLISLRLRYNRIMSHFADILKSRSKGNLWKAAEATKILSGIWLELRYMWRPLIYDMMSIEEAVRRMQSEVETPLQRAYQSKTNQSSLSSSVSGNTLVVGNTATGQSSLRILGNFLCTRERSVHAAVGLKVVTRDIYMMDPVVTGFELIPWSFISEWFISIGSMLRAFSPFATGQLQYASLATSETITYNSVFNIGPASGLTGGAMSCSCVRVSTNYSRVKATPSPTLSVYVDLDVSKVIDLLAIWITMNNSITKRLMRFFK